MFNFLSTNSIIRLECRSRALPPWAGWSRIARPSARKSVVKKYQCFFCGYVYDEAAGDPAEGIAPGTRWEDIPDDWYCPSCGAAKSDFAMMDA